MVAILIMPFAFVPDEAFLLTLLPLSLDHTLVLWHKNTHHKTTTTSTRIDCFWFVLHRSIFILRLSQK